MFGLGFQCTRSVPLPNRIELILVLDALSDDCRYGLLNCSVCLECLINGREI